MILLHEYEIKVLKLLKERKSASVQDLEAGLGLGTDEIVWALENLAKSNAVTITRMRTHSVEITPEGRSYMGQFPEEALARSLGRRAVPVEKVKDRIGLMWAKRNGWIEISEREVRLTGKGAAHAKSDAGYEARALINELGLATGEALERLIEENTELVKTLSDRNLIRLKKKSEITKVAIGGKAGAEVRAGATAAQGELTPDMIKSGRWKSMDFRPYDINAAAEPAYAARPHPMHELIDRIRGIWLGMGFIETSGPIIEPAFWVFDALFEPQDHPAREMQDTFYLSNPRTIDIDDVELIAKVKREHTLAWNEAWQEELAKQALLRTHATSVSAHRIREYARMENAEYPVRLFSVGKVFRNESLDYKHLAELHQFDGIVIGDGLTLANLIDVLKRFYRQLGIGKVGVRPSYFPFVEPGLEMYYYDDELKDEIELCGAGIIRREITRAMGTDKTVLAWGGGIERFMFKFLGIKTVTELYKNEVSWLRSRRELGVQ